MYFYNNNFFFIPFIFSFLFTFSLIMFYLDDFKLSRSSLIKYLQIFCFIGILLFPLIYYYCIIDYINIINCLDDNSKDSVNLHGHITIDKDAAKTISQGVNQGISTVGTQIGLGASIVGIGGAVSKGIAKSSMPPVQKAAVIVASGIITGLGHSIISNINRKNTWEASSLNIDGNTVNNDNINSNINRFMDNNMISSPLENLLFDIEALNYICLSLVIILMIQILFKFFIKENVTLNLFSKLGVNINNKLEYYLNKIIKLNKKMNNIYIWLIFILLLIGLSLSAYASGDLYNDLDTYINIHNSLKNNK